MFVVKYMNIHGSAGLYYENVEEGGGSKLPQKQIVCYLSSTEIAT